MSEQHTPGPWSAMPYERSVAIFSDDAYIAAVYDGPQIDRDQRLANARLMAAAPELLAALQAVWEAYEEGYETEELTPAVADKVHAAIARATGQEGPR